MRPPAPVLLYGGPAGSDLECHTLPKANNERIAHSSGSTLESAGNSREEEVHVAALATTERKRFM